MTNSVNLRAVVLDILLEINENDSYSHIVINGALTKYQYLDKNERAFITRLSEGTLERQIELDFIINCYSKTKTSKMKPVIRNIIRMAVYQIKYMSNVPVSAACNEAVKLASKRGFATLRGFVNGVLRNIARNIETIEYPADNSDEYISVKYSIPMWIIKEWQKSYTNDKIQNILKAFEKDKITYIRRNRARFSEEKLLESLQKDNVTVKKNKYVDYVYEISNYNYISELDAFEQGMFQVQDISSTLAGVAAGIKGGEYIADTCAAPGGKCIHAAETLCYMSNNKEHKGIVDARDISDSKVDIIRQNCERLETELIQLKSWDAREIDEELIEKVDILLADVPCSGLGILGRKADIKYKMSLEKQHSLVDLQREILSTITRYVKKGGKLIYSTCTINEKENIENVKWIVENFGFKLVSLEEEFPFFKDEQSVKQGYMQFLPDEYETDGFFVAKMVKVN